MSEDNPVSDETTVLPPVPDDEPNSVTTAALEAALYHLPTAGSFLPGVTSLMLHCRCGAEVDVQSFENHVLEKVGETLL